MAKEIGRTFLGVNSDDEYRKFELEQFLDASFVEPVKAMLLEKSYSKLMFDAMYARLRRPLAMIWVDYKSLEHDESDTDDEEASTSPSAGRRVSDVFKGRSGSSVAMMLDIFGVRKAPKATEDLSEKLIFERLVDDESLFVEFEAYLMQTRPDLAGSLRFYREVQKEFTNTEFLTRVRQSFPTSSSRIFLILLAIRVRGERRRSASPSATLRSLLRKASNRAAARTRLLRRSPSTMTIFSLRSKRMYQSISLRHLCSPNSNCFCSCSLTRWRSRHSKQL